MLKITIEGSELFDESTQEFINVKSQTIQLEHSLVSLSKWESKWCKPFLSKEEMSYDETIYYIQCMTLTQNVDPNIYKCLTNKHILEIKEYIKAPMTATTFSDRPNGSGREIITAEIIYYQMIAFNIPFECQKWHLNRLLTLIKVCSIKNTPAKKMSTHEILSRNAALNAARRKQYNSRG